MQFATSGRESNGICGRESREIDDFWTRESWNLRLLEAKVVGKSSANRRQIEVGSVNLELTTTFGRFADDLPTTFAGRANRRQIELGSVFVELATTFGLFADDFCG